MNKKQAMMKLLGAYAKDASPEEFEQVATLVMDDAGTAPAPAKTTDGEGKSELLSGLLKLMASDEKPESKAPAALDKALDERLKRIEDAVAKLADTKATDEEKDPDDVTEDEDGDEDKKALDEAVEEESKSTEDEDGDEDDKKQASDALRKQIIKDMAPFIAALPEKKQKTAKDALLKSLKQARQPSETYATIKKMVDSHGKSAAKAVDYSNIGMEIAKARNPHYAQKA